MRLVEAIYSARILSVGLPAMLESESKYTLNDFPKSKNMPLVSVIIPTHNRLKTLKLVLNSVLRSSYKNLEIIVIDDNSSDGTYEYVIRHYPSVKIFRTARIVLPTLARNIGYRLSKGDYLMFLDDDCLLMEKTIEVLVDCMLSYPSIGVIGPMVYDHTGKLQCCGMKVFPFFRWQKVDEGEVSKKLIECDALPGTCIMTRKSVLEVIGGWDYKNNPWHGEDADLCLRARKAGFKIVCSPQAKVIHLSSEWIKVPTRTRAYFTAKSRIRFYKIHFPRVFFIYMSTINLIITFFYILFFLFRGKREYILDYVKGVADGLRQA
jgi:GT2 family glycosyltransferase